MDEMVTLNSQTFFLFHKNWHCTSATLHRYRVEIKQYHLFCYLQLFSKVLKRWVALYIMHTAQCTLFHWSRKWEFHLRHVAMHEEKLRKSKGNMSRELFWEIPPFHHAWCKAWAIIYLAQYKKKIFPRQPSVKSLETDTFFPSNGNFFLGNFYKQPFSLSKTHFKGNFVNLYVYTVSLPTYLKRFYIYVI